MTDKESKLRECSAHKKLIMYCPDCRSVKDYEAGRQAERDKVEELMKKGMLLSNIQCQKEVQYVIDKMGRLVDSAEQAGWNKCIEECCQECQM